VSRRKLAIGLAAVDVFLALLPGLKVISANADP
jgi:hypothetical protein